MDHGAQVLARFASVLASIGDDLDPASRLCESARLTVGADDAAITLQGTAGRHTVLGAAGLASATFASLQQLAGEGPLYDVLQGGDPVDTSMDGAGLDRWPTLSAVAERDDVHGRFWSVPMRPADLLVGVLTLHREVDLLRESIAVVRFIADTVGSVLINDAEVATLPDPVRGAWADRAEVHQATGMVVAQMRLSPVDALATIRAHAYATNRELHAVALDVVAGLIDFSTDRGDPHE